jgi:hypothetical protein
MAVNKTWDAGHTLGIDMFFSFWGFTARSNPSYYTLFKYKRGILLGPNLALF